MIASARTAAGAAARGRCGPEHETGFNLLELMLAVAIGGVLLAVALPSFQSSLENQQVRGAASDLHLALVQARSEAIKRNRNIDVTAAGTWTSGWSVTVQGTSTVLRANDPLDGVTLACSTDTDTETESCPSSITFGRSGRPTSFLEFRAYSADNSSIRARCVAITPSGRPRVVADSDDDPANGCD